MRVNLAIGLHVIHKLDQLYLDISLKQIFIDSSQEKHLRIFSNK